MKKLALVIALAVLAGCAGMTPAPRPECQGAVIVGSPFDTFGSIAIQETWIGYAINNKSQKPQMHRVASRLKTAAELGTVQGIILALSVDCGDYAMLMIPLVDEMRIYGLPTLHPCDKEFLVRLFTNLEAYSS